MSAQFQTKQPTASEGYVPVGKSALYFREIGQGQPIIVLHGGPDFDQGYLLPDMDRLAGDFRLIYYDQRGRGKSTLNVQPEDVSIASDCADLDALREFLRLPSVAILGHSWGGVLAMEYALRYPTRVSHLILMNSAAASRQDSLGVRQVRLAKEAGTVAKLEAILATDEYLQGDPAAITEHLRIHFASSFRRPAQFEQFMQILSAGFTKESILRTRAIEDRLIAETFAAEEYDLLPKLKALTMPTLLIHGDHDFIPTQCAAHIAEAIPGARLVVLEETGHFAYIESPSQVRDHLVEFFQDNPM